MIWNRFCYFVLAAALTLPASAAHAADSASPLEKSQKQSEPAEAQTAAVKPGSFKVAAIQAVSEMGNPEKNRTHLADLVRQAAKEGAVVVVLPETAITGYMNTALDLTWQVDSQPITQGLKGQSPELLAETVPGPSTNQFCQLAKELKIYLTIPFLEIDPKTKQYYNTLVLAGPDGKILLHYRKLNPWPFAERGWASKGDRDLTVIDTPLGRMGLLICFDINFEPPNLQKLGVDHLLYSIAWVDSQDSPWFEEKLPAIAKQNNMNIIGANWTIPADQKVNWHGYGMSRIIDRTGRILARPNPPFAEQILYADLEIPVKMEK